MTSNIEMLVSLTTAFINTKYNDTIPTIEQIEEEATTMREKMSAGYAVSDDEFNRVVDELKMNIRHSIGHMVSLKGHDADHKSWYFVQENDEYFWQRYKKYLRDSKRWSREIIDRLDETTNNIMDDLGDPKDANRPFQRRGLLLGDVQSGKTATYTAICNKAADSGYKVIIILAGMMENLRAQTQGRLDSEFVGKSSRHLLDKNANKEILNQIIGVGKIGPLIAGKDIDRFTSVEDEFSKKLLKSVGLSLQNRTALFVVKKNKSVLNNLHEWLVSNNTNPNSGLIELPLLLIDDEADNASVNTNSEEKDPTAINKAIRMILNSFKQASYIGITATPFANIFIDPDPEDEEARDLFPKDFLTVLPTPERYIGADKIFGNGDADNWSNDVRVAGEYRECLIPIKNSEQKDFYVFKHKKVLADKLCYLPDSLYEAIRYFILVTGISDYRMDNKEHRSMLVNVSRYTDVQNVTAELIGNFVGKIKRDVGNYSQLGAKALEIDSIKALKAVWDKFLLQEKANLSWDDYQRNYLNKAVRRIVVREVNQSTGAASLNYIEYENTGMRVIAVGGNSLSRGLTLEGLCVSYFYRNTMMYDTLLQMGRWFGYRPNYDDLFKIWMCEDGIEWFGYITDAVNELKQELRLMERQNLIPDDFGLKVRRAPGALMVTANNKMRTASKVSCPITVAGRMIETPRLLADRSTIEQNESLCGSILRDVNQSKPYVYDECTNAYIWKDIPKGIIVQLVKSFKSHPWNLNFQSMALAEYIENDASYMTWDIAIPQGKRTDKDSVPLFIDNEHTINLIPEKRKLERDTTIKNLIKVNGHHVRVGTGGCSKIGLSEETIKDIKDKNSVVTDKTYLHQQRKPIALIHVIKNNTPVSERDAKDPDIIYALGLGFPSVNGDDTRQARYVINVRELNNWVDIADLEEDDDDDNN